MGKKDGEVLSKEEKAAKKAAKAAKRAQEEVEAAPPAKKAKIDDDETPVKLTKEEKAAKKAAKEEKKAKKAAAKEPEPAVEAEKPSKKDKKDKKDKTKNDGADDEKLAKKAKKEAKEEVAAPAPAPAAEPEGEARVFVGNLPFKMTDEWMQEEFDAAGKITKFEWLSHSDTGRFKGSGFLTFGTKAEAEAALALNAKEVEGRPMKVELATPRKAGPPGGIAGSGDVGEPSASIFCGNLSWNVTEEALRDAFKDCGAIQHIKWAEKDGEFRGYCFIDFESVEAATKAVALADTNVAGRPMRINFSKSKPAGDKPAWGASGGGGAWKEKPGGGGGRTERPYKPQGAKPDGCLELFCGNLPWSIDETKIAEFFAKAGATVASTRWLNDKETGEFKGIGFVAFSDTADVDKAVALGGENLEGRPIRLDYAGQKKDDKPKGAWQGGW